MLSSQQISPLMRAMSLAVTATRQKAGEIGHPLEILKTNILVRSTDKVTQSADCTLMMKTLSMLVCLDVHLATSKM